MEASTQAVLESFNPTTGELLGSVPATAPEQVQAVADDVAEVQPFWAQLPLSDRARYMRRTAQVVIDHLDELVRLVTRELGMPRVESYSMELVPTVDALHWIADNGPKILADDRLHPTLGSRLHRRSFLAYEPLGVVGVIGPWNQPWSGPFVQAALALMSGNGVVLKPSELTPLIGQGIQDVFARAGVPDGLVRVVQGGEAVGAAVVEASSVAKVFFTGSGAAGRKVAAACAERVKGAVLELGGKDPQLVLADAHVANAVAGCAWGGFANAGQSASGIERVYVMRSVAERFVAGVVSAAERLTVGDPMHWDTEVGPLASSAGFERVRELVDDAVAAGATLRCGGPVERDGLGGGSFFAPAVLTGVTHDMRIMREEVLGPVVPIVEVRSEEEAIELANDSRFGLGASVWTSDRGKGERIARRLEAGSTWVNDHMHSHGPVRRSWSGVKESGLGRTHARFGFYECVNVKHVTVEPAGLRSFRWHPYDESLGTALHAAAQLLYGRDEDKRAALKRGAAPFARVGRRVLGAGRRR